LQAQFPVFQFTIQISLQDGGHSMTYFSLKQFLYLSTNFTAFSVDFVFILRFSCNVSGNAIS
jgi:hypothetical protein